MDMTLMVFRMVVGLLMAGHGSQKLFGMFGGNGPDGTAEMFDRIGLRPGRAHAMAAGAMELGAGIMLVMGFLTPIAAAMVIAVMTAAILTVHAPKGLWNTEGGMEYNLVLAGAAFVLAGVGPGSWSFDSAMGLYMNGGLWAFGALGAGALGGACTVLFGRNYERIAAARSERPRTAPRTRPV